MVEAERFSMVLWGGGCAPRSRDNSGFQSFIDPSAYKHRERRGSWDSREAPPRQERSTGLTVPPGHPASLCGVQRSRGCWA